MGGRSSLDSQREMVCRHGEVKKRLLVSTVLSLSYASWRKKLHLEKQGEGDVEH